MIYFERNTFCPAISHLTILACCWTGLLNEDRFTPSQNMRREHFSPADNVSVPSPEAFVASGSQNVHKVNSALPNFVCRLRKGFL